MKVSRRTFMARSAAGIAAVGTVGVLGAAEEKSAAVAQMVAACGISCSTCPLLKADKCKGCGPANAVAAEMVTKKNCSALTCAAAKKIAFCGTDCKMFTKCAKLVGRPYAKEFMDKLAAKLG